MSKKTNQALVETAKEVVSAYEAWQNAKRDFKTTMFRQAEDKEFKAEEAYEAVKKKHDLSLRELK